MASKYIDNGSYATSGYTLSGVFQSITLGPAGTIGGPGLIGGTHEAYTIVNRGRITGAYDGIYLHDGGSVSNAATIALIAGYDGVHIAGEAGSVGNSGTIDATGTKGIGVLLEAGGAVANNGTAALIEGVYAVDVAGGGARVANAGLVVGAEIAVFLQDGGVVVNTGTAARIVGGDGIVVNQTAGTVLNAGTIAATLNGAGDVNFTIANAYGVLLAAGGMVTNGAGGTIEVSGSYAIAVDLKNRGSVVNAGIIEATGSFDGAIVLENSATLVNLAGGLISPGVSATYSTIFNDGTVTGVGLTNSTLTNQSEGLIVGSARGLSLDHANATNSGTIEATGTHSSGIFLSDASFFSNAAGGLVDALRTGAYCGDHSTLSNAGTIVTVGTFGAGVYATGAIIDNAKSGLIQGQIGVTSKSTALTLSNLGTIIGIGATIGITPGVALYAGGIVTNTGSAALIKGWNFGISVVSVAATVVNSGTIMSTHSASAGVGLDVSGATVTNASGGLIEGPLAGVYVDANCGVTNKSGGTIEGTYAGIRVGSDEPGNPNAFGTIQNSGIVEASSVRGSGIYLYAGATVTNARSGVVDGIQAIGGDLTLVNAGTITGDIYAAFRRNSVSALACTITNTGTTGSVYLFGGGVINNGSIVSTISNGGTANTDAVDFGGGIGTIINAGTIDAAGSNAIGILILPGVRSIIRAHPLASWVFRTVF